MGVAVSDVDTLMPHTLRDGQGGKTHVDQQTDMAMSQIFVFGNCLLILFFIKTSSLATATFFSVV